MLGDITEGVHRVARCRLSRHERGWAFADAARDDIERHWHRRQQEMPQFFNGRVFIMTTGSLTGDALTGELAETDFASSLYWRETGYRDATVLDCFGSAILLSADNHLVYGRQAAGNVNSGLSYPPGGFIDTGDFSTDAVVDLDRSILREIVEETGVDPRSLERAPGYLVTRDGPLLSVGIVYRSAHDGAALASGIAQYLAAEARPELERITLLARRAEIAAHAMPGYARMLAEALLAG